MSEKEEDAACVLVSRRLLNAYPLIWLKSRRCGCWWLESAFESYKPSNLMTWLTIKRVCMPEKTQRLMRFIWSWTITYPVLVTHGNISKVRQTEQMPYTEKGWGVWVFYCATLTTAVMLITSFCFKQSLSDPLVLVLGFFKSLKGWPSAYNIFCRADKEKAVFCSYYNHFQVIESLQIVHVWKKEVVTMVFWMLTAFFFQRKKVPRESSYLQYALFSSSAS